MKDIRVTVPATAANLGPGFDVLALALSLHNEVTVSCSEPRRHTSEAALRRALLETELRITVHGEGADALPANKTNLVYRAMKDVFLRTRRVPARLEVNLANGIPLTRGLGSSAAAIVAGLLAANAACGDQLSPQDLLDLAAAREGHGDNVAAALLGGLTASVMTQEGLSARRLPIADRYRVVVAVPDYPLPTRKARAALPGTVARDDAVFSLSRTALLVALLAAGSHEGLAEAMQDRLHQPHRSPLLPGFREAAEAAMRAGALGTALSGAGPSVIAFVPRNKPHLFERVGSAMVQAYRRKRIQAVAWVLRIDRRGARMRTT